MVNCWFTKISWQWKPRRDYRQQHRIFYWWFYFLSNVL